MYIILKSLYLFIYNLIRLVLILFNIVLYPILILFRLHKKNICYFSLVRYEWINQRPQEISIHLSKNDYHVTYSFVYQNNNECTDKMVSSYLRIKDYPYNDNNKIFNRIYLLFKTFIMNYNYVIISNPNQLKYIDIYLLKTRGIKVIYDCMDLYEYWVDNKQLKYYYHYEKKIVKYSNIIITSSTSLKESILSKYSFLDKDKIETINNGFYFNKVNISRKYTLKHPNLVYIGTIDEYLDFDSLKEFALNNKKYHIYLVGPVMDKVGKIKLPSNIHLYGAINHEYLPAFVKECDTMIIPFKVNELIKCVNPIKIYEYLYFNKPVISSYWCELDIFKKYIKFYNGTNTIEKCLDKLNNFKGYDSSLQTLLNKSTWDKRTKEYIKVIKQV